MYTVKVLRYRHFLQLKLKVINTLTDIIMQFWYVWYHFKTNIARNRLVGGEGSSFFFSLNLFCPHLPPIKIP